MSDAVDEATAGSGRAKGYANLKPFKKGQSGNPSGMSKVQKNVADIAKDNSPKAMERLAKLMNSKNEAVALAACNAILDRAVGKPKQSIEKTTKKEAADYDAAELLALARMGSARAAETPSGEAEPHRVQ